MCVCALLVVVSSSPHPVKPLTTILLAEEKRTEGRSVLATGLEKLKSTIHPGRSSQLSEQETDRKKVQCLLQHCPLEADDRLTRCLYFEV